MSSTTKKSFLALIKGAWDATVNERPRFFLFNSLFIFANTLDLLTPWALGYTLGIFVEKGMTPEAFHRAAFWLAVYTILRISYTICHHLARYVQNRVAYSARMYTLTRIFDCFMRYPLRWHIERHSGENLSKLHRTAGAIDSLIGTYVWQFDECVVKIIFAGIAIFALDIKVAVTVLGVAALSIYLMVFFNKKLTSRIRRNNLFGNKINRICVDYLTNVVTVKTLNVEESARRHLRTQREEGLHLAQRISSYMELKWGSTSVGAVAAIVLSLLVYFYDRQARHIQIQVAEVYVLMNYIDRIFAAVGSFTGYYSGLIEGSTAYEDATELIQNLPVHGDGFHKNALNVKWSRASFKKLNFSYVENEKVGLNNVEFDLAKGEKIALVGPSGSGKSTLLKVLGGLIEPDTYALSTDVQASVSLEEFVRCCLLIPQEPEIFSETFIYNLTMGEEFNSQEISFFVSLCKLNQVLGELPNGLESNLAEKGLNLSVGEKQRVALARGLLRAGGKDILLLDEPTSSLDPKTEKEIFLGVLYHFSDRTVVSSCHRLNLIPLFDKIVFMSQSQVLEVGTFPELIERRGHFFRAWDDYERNIKAKTPSQPASQSTTAETVM